MDFKKRRAKFLLDLMACDNIGEVTRLTGKEYGAGSMTARVIVANVDVRTIAGTLECYHDTAELDKLEGVCQPQVWIQGETGVIWWDPESGRYVEFQLKDY